MRRKSAERAKRAFKAILEQCDLVGAVITVGVLLIWCWEGVKEAPFIDPLHSPLIKGQGTFPERTPFDELQQTRAG